MLSSPESSGKRHRRILNSLGPRRFHRRARPSWIASPPSLAGDGKRRLGDCLRAPPPADELRPHRRSSSLARRLARPPTPWYMAWRCPSGAPPSQLRWSRRGTRRRTRAPSSPDRRRHRRRSLARLRERAIEERGKKLGLGFETLSPNGWLV